MEVQRIEMQESHPKIYEVLKGLNNMYNGYIYEESVGSVAKFKLLNTSVTWTLLYGLLKEGIKSSQHQDLDNRLMGFALALVSNNIIW